MPIYEYGCNECGHEFETLVRSDTVPDCPRCHSTALERRLSVFATAGSAAGTIVHRGGPLRIVRPPGWAGCLRVE